MLDSIQIMLTIAVGVQLGWIMYTVRAWVRDQKAMVADAVDDAIKRQDDRIRKRIERSEEPAIGQEPDTPRTGIRAGYPVRR